MVVGELAHEREVIIIGGGPGGYHAAIRAAQLGKQVTLIEKDEMGGVCLNQGCIPSKVFTHAGERLAAAKWDGELGIDRGEGFFQFNTLLNYKEKLVKQLRQGVEALCKANKIEIIKGTAFFLSDEKIGVEHEDRYDVFKFSQCMIATGGKPILPENLPIESERIFHPYTISRIQAVPEELIIYGSDYIALELAMAFQSFGSKVTLVFENGLEDFAFDPSLNKELKRVFKKGKIAMVKGMELSEVIAAEEDITLVLKDVNGIKTLSGTHLVVSLGTKPNIEQLGLDRLSIQMESGYVKTNAQQQTNIPHIYAVGDVTEGPNLAVKAIKQGKTAAENICGLSSETDLQWIPTVVQTNPPIAFVGLTEKQALDEGYEFVTSEFSLSANGFAALVGKKEGVVKLVMEKNTDLMLGVHLMGHGAVELITSGTLALEMIARDEDLKFPLFPHPSINEALLEAVEALKGQAIHAVPQKHPEQVIHR